MFGAFSFSQGELDGAFVNLAIDEDAGTLYNVTVNKPFGPVAIFRSVTVSPPDAGTVAADGTQFSFQSGSVSVVLHNNPTVGLVHMARSVEVVVTYELEVGMSAVSEGLSVYVSGGGVRSRVAMFGEGSINVAADRVTVTLRPGASSAFRVMLVTGDGPAGALDQAAIGDAFGRGMVGEESFLVALEGAILSDDVDYRGVSVSIRLVGPGVVEATVTSDVPQGRAIVLNLNAGVFDGRHQDALEVRLDGATIPAADSADAVMSAGQAAYHASADDDGLVFVAFLPSFSTHTLRIELPDLLPLWPRDAVGFAALGAAIAFIGVAAVLAVRKHREKF
jgi:hypothetical protein